MKEMPSISESELEIMKLLWEKSPLTSNEIIDSIDPSMNWSDNTVKTFINRLLNKEAIVNERSGRSYLYYPNVSYDEFLERENKSFLNTIYGGSVDLLLSKFIEDENLSDDDIDELQKILNEKKSK